MTTLDFEALNTDQQAMLVYDGTFLCELKVERVIIQLHYVKHFYVEVFCSSIDETILRMLPFTNRSKLERYWEKVSLKELEVL